MLTYLSCPGRKSYTILIFRTRSSSSNRTPITSTYQYSINTTTTQPNTMEYEETSIHPVPALSHIVSLLPRALIAYLLPPIGIWLAIGYPSFELALDILLCLTSNHQVARYHALLRVLFAFWNSRPGIWVTEKSIRGRGDPIVWDMRWHIVRNQEFRGRESLKFTYY